LIEAETQAVLNSLRENKTSSTQLKMAEALGMVHMRGKGITSRVMMAGRPKVSL
jgi:hypothetical protein